MTTLMGTRAGATTNRIIVNVNNANTNYIDVSKLLSQVNHRLYRQGRMYCVRVGYLGAHSGVRAATVYALPNNWAFRKGHSLAHAAFREAMKSSAISQSKSGRWSDFRIKHDLTQYSAQHEALDAKGVTLGAAEYLYSQVAGDTGFDGSDGDGAPNIYGFHGVGNSTSGNEGVGGGYAYATTGSFGVIYEYQKTEDTETNTPPDHDNASAYRLLDSDGDRSMANEMLKSEIGDNPPYNHEDLQYQEQQFTIRFQGTGSADIATPWIAAPCGLLKIETTEGSGTDDIFIEIMQGNYKGVLAEDM